jgi:DNA-binding CsgD family transcriptional regulator
MEGLTKVQETILQLLIHGNRTSEIAKRLSLSFKQVSDEITLMKAHFGVDNTHALVQLSEQEKSDN